MGRFFTLLGRILSFVFLTALTLICVGPLVASQMYLERSGIITGGTVVGKNERVQDQSRSNGWSRRLTLDVRFVPHDDPEAITTSIPVDLALYDAYDIGAPVDVRYAPDRRVRMFGFFGVKLAEQPPFAFLGTFTDSESWHIVVLFLVGIAVVWLMFRTRSIVLRFGLGFAIVSLIAMAFVVSLRPAAIFEPGPRATVTARVIDVERITDTPGRRSRTNNELIRPIDRVKLQFTPNGRAGSVVAVDDIDADSLAGIAKGQERAVSYPLANPRSAHLVGASYQHRWQNWLTLPLMIALVVVVALVLNLGSKMLGRAIRRTPRRVTP